MGKKGKILLSIGIFLLVFGMFPLISAFNFEGDGVKIISPLEANGAIPVNIQDQHTRPIDIKLYNQINDTFVLSQDAVIGSYDINVTTTNTILAGDNIAVYESNGFEKYYFGQVLSVSGSTLSLDTPVPFNFSSAEAMVFQYENEMNVDGSSEMVVYSITNFFETSVDITRFIFHCTDATDMDDSLFCGRSALTRGIVLRKKLTDGSYINYWNVKTNGDWTELAYDKSYDDKAPAGFYGFASRLTYAGQDKHGVTIRLKQGESIELIVQDDLTGLNTATITAQGHFIYGVNGGIL